jgi:hypothetical protein
MYVCMYVLVYLCMYVCISVFMYVCMYVCRGGVNRHNRADGVDADVDAVVEEGKVA